MIEPLDLGIATHHLETLAEKDSKRKTKLLGADMATADKVALAVIKRKK